MSDLPSLTFLATREDWQLDAACRNSDPNLFVPAKADGGVNTARAKAICAGCPVAAECLDYALRIGEQRGIYGGTTPNERRQMDRPSRVRVGPAIGDRCGTTAGAAVHRRQGTPLCVGCRFAYNDYKAAYKRRRRVDENGAAA